MFINQFNVADITLLTDTHITVPSFITHRYTASPRFVSQRYRLRTPGQRETLLTNITCRFLFLQESSVIVVKAGRYHIFLNSFQFIIHNNSTVRRYTTLTAEIASLNSKIYPSTQSQKMFQAEVTQSKWRYIDKIISFLDDNHRKCYVKRRFGDCTLSSSSCEKIFTGGTNLCLDQGTAIGPNKVWNLVGTISKLFVTIVLRHVSTSCATESSLGGSVRTAPHVVGSWFALITILPSEVWTRGMNRLCGRSKDTEPSEELRNWIACVYMLRVSSGTHQFCKVSNCLRACIHVVLRYVTPRSVSSWV